ncbi:single-stranded DNA-binding protein [Georgenia sp. Z1344]|uniref:single-stranded DNA-binding protein n=1 Tax=Georgenia sp. Z1344 TaxID=3416706 RepID=UPI003CF38E56
MSNEIQVTVRGNAAADAILRTTESGTPWVSFRLGSTPRKFDTVSNTWVDGPTQWFNVKNFGRMAPHIGASVKKGTPVLVRGNLATETWTGKDGGERTNLVINGESVALEMSRGLTTYTKVDNGTAGQGEQQGPASSDGDLSGAPEVDEADGVETGHGIESEPLEVDRELESAF